MRKTLPLMIVRILIFITVLFIFSRSLPDKAQSKEESMKVTEVVTPILEPVVGEGNVTDPLVRKLAHFVEFCTLGMELSVYLWLKQKKELQSYLNAAFFAVITALCDETIQLFTARGSQVQDVWLDISGALSGLLIIIAIRRAVDILLIHKKSIRL